MVFMGSIVEEGKGKVVITATGLNTEIGKISQLVKNEISPLVKGAGVPVETKSSSTREFN